MTCRILVADDERDTAESLALLLRLDGHDVEVVHDGQQALTVVAAFKPHVAFLDISMPDVDGYDIAQRIRADSDDPSVVLVALTGWGRQKDKDRALQAGFNLHLVKPVDHSTVQQLLLEACPEAAA